ncbi:MAG: PA14 domain-containing protein, partial [Chloroflexi bacterium]|nr:PA14 domain-containing protein [Chloroflexota bacterium]
MRGLVQGILAVVLAIVAEGVLYRRVVGLPVDVPVAVLLYAVAAFLMYRAVSPGVPWPERFQDSHWRRPIFKAVGRRGWIVGVGAVCANLVALVLFGRDVQVNLAWVFYLGSMILVAVAAYYLDPPEQRSLAFRRSRVELIGLAVVMLVGIFFRTYRINSYPAGLWFDEAQQGLASLKILSDPSYRPIWLGGISPDPAMRMYWQALFFVLFGASKLSLRLIPVLGGTLGVFGAYLLARELYGWRTGLIAGFLTGVFTWNVNFSRLDLSGIWAVTFDAYAAYFLIKGLRQRRYLDFALAGVSLGLGVNSYYTSYLFTVVIALLLLYRLATERAPFLRGALAGVFVFAVALVITVAPLAEFALLHPTEYSARLNQVSMLQQVREQHSLVPLEDSLRKHLLMFNYQGDANGRHNLSGWPELDPISGALFVLGLVICLVSARRWNYLFPVVALLTILCGGIFSVGFEAPQSVRTVDNSLISAIIAAIPVGFLWTRLADLNLGRLTVPVGHWGVTTFSTGALATMVLLGWIGGLNFQRYFVLQAQDNASYSAYSIGPTLIAETMNHLGTDYDVYMSPIFIGQPSIPFLDPHIKVEIPFNPGTTLPLHDNRNVAIFLDSREDLSINVLRRMYPAATFQAYRLNQASPVVMYGAFIPLSQIQAQEGADLSLYAATTPTQAALRSQRTSKQVDFDWSKQTPLPVPFVAKWQGVLDAPSYGKYQFRIEGPSTSILRIDENTVVKGNDRAVITLAEGLHQFELTAPFTRLGVVRLWWRTPNGVDQVVPAAAFFRPAIDNRGLLATYYPNANWSGTPRLEVIDPTISTHFHFLPLPQPFTVEWSGKIDIPTPGLYRFGTQSIDYSWVYIDNHLVVDNSHQEDQYVDGAINLSAGLHDIRIRFLDRSGHSFINVFWWPPGGAREFLPGDRLFPPQGSYPERAGPLRPQAPIQPIGAPPPPPPQ